MAWSDGITPTPQMPQSSAFPWHIRRSRYIAWCARWNPPTPKWTMPTLTAERSYEGTSTAASSEPNVFADRAVT